MSDEQLQLDDDGQSLLAELLATPVGRRSVLKAGLGVGGSAGGRLARGAGRGRRGAEEAPEGRDDGPAIRARSCAWGVASDVARERQRIALKRHTKASRDALRRQGGLWGAVDLSQLTHHVAGVKLPADRGLSSRCAAGGAGARSWSRRLSYAPRAVE